MKDIKILEWNTKWLVISIVLVGLVFLLTSFNTPQKSSWEQKYHEVKKERDYYKKSSEQLLRNWKNCEEKLNTIVVSEQVN